MEGGSHMSERPKEKKEQEWNDEIPDEENEMPED